MGDEPLVAWSGKPQGSKACSGIIKYEEARRTGLLVLLKIKVSKQGGDGAAVHALEADEAPSPCSS